MARHLQFCREMSFFDRKQAGVFLSARLKGMTLRNPLVLALPRGGVPVALEIARALHAPLDVFVVRKIGSPFQPELGVGAIAEGGHYWLDPKIMQITQTESSDLTETIRREQLEVERRVHLYRQGRPLPSLHNRSVILVDDGLATGVTARIACAYLKQKGAEEVVLAVPVCAPSTVEKLRGEVDKIVCLEQPEVFFGVGQFYENFAQLSDNEVIALLEKAKNEQDFPVTPREVVIQDGVALDGLLAVPEHPQGIVLFAHGSGSSRFSPRNQQVAEVLNEAGIGTLLFDLLTPEESEDRRNVFDIPLLAERLVIATHWLRSRTEYTHVPIGFFGASTGGGAALWAAAELDGDVSAVVSRGGRPDLAMQRLHEVEAPTLLLVGARDHPVLEMNRHALTRLKHGQITVIPGATHLFEEPGTLELVETHAKNWFLEHFKKGLLRAAA